MNAKLYREYENETEIAGQYACTYTEWLEGRVLETLVQQSLSGSDSYEFSRKSAPPCPQYNNGVCENTDERCNG